MNQYLKEVGPDLIDKGYSIVPIKPGYKYPKGLNDWRNVEATHSDVKRWSNNGFSGGGVGVICGRVIGVDLDILDQSIAKKLIKWCEDHLGHAPQRIGLAPKTLFVFRTNTPFSKITSKSYTDMFEDVHRIEILGKGQQFVAYAKHPDTDKPYSWVNGPGLSDFEYDDLPEITMHQAEELIDYFETIVPEDWDIVPNTNRTRGVSKDVSADDALANVIEKADISLSKIKKMLDATTAFADSRDEWIAFGQALHHQFDGNDEGLALYEEWSSHGATYGDGKDGSPSEKWKGFDSGYSRRARSFRYIIKKYNDLKELEALNNTNNSDSYDETEFEIDDEINLSGPLIDQFIERYVFVETGNMVADLTKPPQYCLSKIDEFRNRTANKRHEVPAPTQAEPDKTKLAPVSNAWLVNNDRKSAQGGAYSPFKERYFKDDWGHGWINTFHMPVFKDCSGNLDVFEEHMQYLLPCENERKWFLDWMAFNVQHPGERSKVTPLHVSNGHGVGRGWVVELMSELLGVWNCTKTKMKVLSGESNAGAFNDFLDKSLLCSVEEVKESSKRYSVADNIRDILTENSLEINIKHGSKKTQPVYTNFFFMSNHPSDALYIPEEDRRIQVLTGPKAARNMAYYDRLYKWLVPKNVGALDACLRARDITDFDWKRSTDTPGRRLMIEGNRTPTETAFWDFMNQVGRVAMTFKDINIQVQNLMEGDDFDALVDENQVQKLLKQNVTHHPSQIKIDGKPVRPWLFGLWSNPCNDEIRASIKGVSYCPKKK